MVEEPSKSASSTATPDKILAVPARRKKKKKSWVMIVLVCFVSVASFYVIGTQLLKYHAAMLEDRKIHIRALVENAYDIVSMYKTKADQGLVTLDEAQRYVKETLKGIRHNKYEYFWLSHVDGTMVMHPVKPELNGRNLEQMTDTDGHYIFRDMTRIVNEKGSGFSYYGWPKPSDPKGPSFPKVSFVKGFQPWGWIIGSGVYIDDVEDAFRNAVYVAGALALAVLFLMITLWFTMTEEFEE